MPTHRPDPCTHHYAHHMHRLQLLENNNNGLPAKVSDVPECPATVPVTYVDVGSLAYHDALNYSKIALTHFLCRLQGDECAGDL